MTMDADKLRELAYSLSEDQRRLLREGFASGENLDVPSLVATLNSAENQRVLHHLAAELPDGGADGGTDGGTGGSTEQPLTRW
ncbi:hypothetical protein ACH41H_36130 [Streptomyces sp. NPDC020800]|uniref:hypothetical protein n=1 Tax=Streptomyces sp. NPDC020800 TaxID=3365092 RepID=UPI0037977796